MGACRGGGRPVRRIHGVRFCRTVSLLGSLRQQLAEYLAANESQERSANAVMETGHHYEETEHWIQDAVVQSPRASLSETRRSQTERHFRTSLLRPLAALADASGSVL